MTTLWSTRNQLVHQQVKTTLQDVVVLGWSTGSRQLYAHTAALRRQLPTRLASIRLVQCMAAIDSHRLRPNHGQPTPLAITLSRYTTPAGLPGIHWIPARRPSGLLAVRALTAALTSAARPKPTWHQTAVVIAYSTPSLEPVVRRLQSAPPQCQSALEVVWLYLYACRRVRWDPVASTAHTSEDRHSPVWLQRLQNYKDALT